MILWWGQRSEEALGRGIHSQSERLALCTAQVGLDGWQDLR